LHKKTVPVRGRGKIPVMDGWIEIQRDGAGMLVSTSFPPQWQAL